MELLRKDLTATQKITVSALVIALYVAIMFVTQSFAFGQYQIRIATAMYALSAIFPFLVIPMALANVISNTLMGGLGPLDIIGGAIVGFVTTSFIVFIKRLELPNTLIALPIILVPGLGVATWLSYLLHIPYAVLAFSLLIGQIIPGIVGAILVTALEKRAGLAPSWKENKNNA